MATVNKDFKIKSGLIVEGPNGTINGSDIITEDAITGGTQTNVTVTYDAQNKVVNFVAENGVADSTTDDLAEGTTNLYFTDERAQDAISVQQGGPLAYGQGVLSLNYGTTFGGLNVDTNQLIIDRNIVDYWYDPAGAAATAEQNANDYTDAAVGAIPSAILSVAGDTGTDSVTLDGDTLTVSGGAGITTSVANDTITVDIDSTVATLTGTQTLTNKTLGSLGGAVSLGYSLDAGNFRIENLGSPLSGTDAANKNYVDTAVSSLVDGAPALLDTLNELAAAINDDASFATTVTNQIATKQDTLTAGNAIFIDGTTDTISVTYDAGLELDGNGKLVVDTDTIASVSYVDNNFVNVADLPGQLDDYVPLTDKGAVNGVATLDANGQVPLNQLGNVPVDYITSVGDNLSVTSGELNIATTPTFTAVDINSVAKQVAATVTSTGSGQDTVYQFDGAAYRSAKFLVKIAYGTHTQVSEVLLTLDTSNNLAITEYAMIGTNGSLGEVTATYGVIDVITNGVSLIVDSASTGAEITVMGTLLA